MCRNCRTTRLRLFLCGVLQVRRALNVTYRPCFKILLRTCFICSSPLGVMSQTGALLWILYQWLYCLKAYLHVNVHHATIGDANNVYWIGWEHLVRSVTIQIANIYLLQSPVHRNVHHVVEAVLLFEEVFLDFWKLVFEGLPTDLTWVVYAADVPFCQ